MMAIIFFSP